MNVKIVSPLLIYETYIHGNFLSRGSTAELLYYNRIVEVIEMVQNSFNLIILNLSISGCIHQQFG